MAENFWEKNCAVLRQRYAGLLKQLESQDDGDFKHEIKIESAPTGDPTLSINGFSIHSPRDPAREGQKLAQSIAAQSVAAQSAEGIDAPVIILGFGLGYAALCAAQSAVQNAAKSAAQKSSQPIIIVEKYIKLVRQALELRDLTELLCAENVIFVVGGTGDGIVNALSIVNDLLKKVSDKNNGEALPVPVIIRNRALMDLDNEWYKNVENKIRTYSMKDKVNTATLKRFGKRWVKNISRNMSAIRDYPGVSRLAGLAAFNNSVEKPLPVFFAAAGPNLDKIQPMLQDIYNRCIIVTVDTNLRFFTNNGIQPDFVLTVDPQFWNSRHLDRCCNSAVREKTALIIESAVYPSLLDLPFKRKFMCGSLFPLSLFIENKVDVKGRLGAGGSVATTAWDFSRSLVAGSQNNSADIWIAGLDLAFPDLRTHFRGARFEESANCESFRLNPVETWVVHALRDGNPFKAKSSTGGQILTDSRLSLYAAWFENQFNQYKNIRNLALFREGLALNGLQSADIKDLLALPERRKEIDAQLNAVYSRIEKEYNSEKEAHSRNVRYDNAVKLLTMALNSVKKTAQEGIRIIQSGRKDAEKELDRITKKIQESDVKEIVSFLMPINANEANDNGDYYKSSLNLFTSLSESADFYLGLM